MDYVDSVCAFLFHMRYVLSEVLSILNNIYTHIYIHMYIVEYTLVAQQWLCKQQLLPYNGWKNKHLFLCNGQGTVRL
jgi:hypothetical protein